MINSYKIFAVLIVICLTFSNCQSQDESKDLSKSVYTESKSASSNLDNSNQQINFSRQNAITKAVQNASPAIVGITVTEVVKVRYRDSFWDDPLFGRFFGYDNAPRYKQYEVQGVGSGFIISPDGYILTNHHVAGDASKIVVTLTSGDTYDADIIGADMVSDVAVLKIKGKNFPFLKLSNSDDVIIGEWVIAFGNPFGWFYNNSKPTVTVGVVSNTGVSFVQEDRVYRDMIQTDAAISSGNSGGPLVNALGEVIGINTVIFSTSKSNQGSGSIGIGFSIPVNRVKEVVDLLVKNKKIDRSYTLGMEVRKIDKQLANYFGLKSTDGVVVVNMLRDGPAMKAGIEPGDIILKVNNIPILKEEDYQIGVLDAKVGDKLSFSILRDDKEMIKIMTLTPFRR